MINLKPLIAPVFMVAGFMCVVKAQTPADTLKARYEACISQGRDKIECGKIWYQQTDSLMEVCYQELKSHCDSVQLVNLEDERQEWMEFRNNYYKSTYAAFKRNNPDDPTEMFKANIAFLNKRIKELTNSVPGHYLPEYFQVGITGKYQLRKVTEQVNADGDAYSTELRVRMKEDGGAYFWLRAHTGGPDRDDITLMDTTRLTGNASLYTYAVPGGTCSIQFRFTRTGVHVQLLREDEKLHCGFGRVLPIDGFYRRISSKAPTDRELTKGLY